jgi:ADP-heptose:LPS heptosyltransferase
MFEHLQIYDRRDRLLVGAADAALAVAAPALRAGRPRPASPPRRILLLRLERIGDLLMALGAIDDVRRAAPAASIDLVVGSWNAELAGRIQGIASVETLDAAWLARDGTGLPLPALLRRARGWRRRAYDLAVNFEPDVRSNLLLAAARAGRTAGFASGGGGALLDVALQYDPRSHTSANAERLAAAVLDVPPRTSPARLRIAAEEQRTAAGLFARCARPLVGIHVSGGRALKQWDPERFGELAGRLARAAAATIVLTGTEVDRQLLTPVLRQTPAGQVLDLAGALELPALAAALEQLDVFVTGDTGPMHLAAAVGTPVVAVFGPSDPARYAPRDPMHRIVRIDLPCSPCNRIRLPPARCAGHVPDCLTGIDVEMVYRAVEATLDRAGRHSVRARTAGG